MKKGKFYKKYVRPIKHGVGFVIIVIAMAFFRILPRRFSLFIGSILGRAGYRIFRKDRKIARENLKIAFPEMPDTEREKIARDTFVHTAKNLVDTIRVRKNVLSDPPIWETEGEEHIEKMRAEYGGCIVIAGHIGCFEAIPGICVRLGLKVAVVGRRLYDEKVDYLLIKQRESLGVINVPSDAHPKSLVKLVRDGYFIGILMDTHTRSVDGLPAEFFGRTVRTISGPISLARLLNRPVLPMSIHRKPGDTFVLKIWPPVEIPSTADKKVDIREGLNRANRVLMEMINRQPEQWIWYHDRFKR